MTSYQCGKFCFMTVSIWYSEIVLDHRVLVKGAKMKDKYIKGDDLARETLIDHPKLKTVNQGKCSLDTKNRSHH